MIQPNKQPIRVAILDLYNGVANEGIRGFKEILQRYKAKNKLDLTYQIFDVRQKEELPGTDFDIYLFSGGPGSPLTENESWDKKYFQLVDKLEDHNHSNTARKKYGFFVCHSFQLLCRKYQLGDINMRRSPSFGVLPIHLTKPGIADAVHTNLTDPFYAVDSRSWQVINPNERQFMGLGMQLLAIEKERLNIDLPRAMMSIRVSPYFVATQFHPEADAQGMKLFLQDEEKRNEVINEHGNDKYHQILENLDNPNTIAHTQNTIIPNFLDEAVLGLHQSV